MGRQDIPFCLLPLVVPGQGDHQVGWTDQGRNRYSTQVLGSCQHLHCCVSLCHSLPLVLCAWRFKLLTSSRFREAPKGYVLELLHADGREWSPLPFKIVAKGGTKPCPTDLLVDLFREIELASVATSTAGTSSSTTSAAASPPPAASVPPVFRPYQTAVQRSNAAGQAAITISLGIG